MASGFPGRLLPLIVLVDALPDLERLGRRANRSYAPGQRRHG
ncbi:hypothetical protein ACGGAQ_08450 [Micromonospora sp. NPDC047557]